MERTIGMTLEAIEVFAKLKIDWFRKYSPLPNGIPRKKTTRSRYFISSLIDPDLFQKSVRTHWQIENCSKTRTLNFLFVN